MFRRFLILLPCLLLISYLYAQDEFKPSTYIGIHGGMNFSRVAFTPSLKQDMISSEAYGIIIRHISERNIGLQFEVNLAGKGWKEVIDSVGSYTRRLQTLDIPVLAAFVAGSRTLRFAFTIGPYVSYLREEKESIQIGDSLDFRDHYLKPLENKWEFGYTGGAAIEIHTRIGAFFIRASYSHALTNLFPIDTDRYKFLGSRNQVIHGGVGYMFIF